MRQSAMFVQRHVYRPHQQLPVRMCRGFHGTSVRGGGEKLCAGQPVRTTCRLYRKTSRSVDGDDDDYHDDSNGNNEDFFSALSSSPAGAQRAYKKEEKGKRKGILQHIKLKLSYLIRTG